MTTMGEINQKKYQLGQTYLDAGWTLEWDEWGWCTAVHPDYDSVNGFPNRTHGLKFIERRIDKVAKKSQDAQLH